MNRTPWRPSGAPGTGSRCWFSPAFSLCGGLVGGRSVPHMAWRWLGGHRASSPPFPHRSCGSCQIAGRECPRAREFSTASSASAFSPGCLKRPAESSDPAAAGIYRQQGRPAFAKGACWSGAVAHGLCLAIHIVLAILALFRAQPWSSVLWILLPAVIVHLYPLLLQRALILRLQPLLDRTMPAREVRELA